MWRKIRVRLSEKSVRRRKIKSAKSILFLIIIGLLLALGIYSRTEAATFTFPNVSAEPNTVTMLTVWAPSGIENYFKEDSAVETASTRTKSASAD